MHPRGQSHDDMEIAIEKCLARGEGYRDGLSEGMARVFMAMRWVPERREWVLTELAAHSANLQIPKGGA